MQKLRKQAAKTILNSIIKTSHIGLQVETSPDAVGCLYLGAILFRNRSFALEGGVTWSKIIETSIF